MEPAHSDVSYQLSSLLLIQYEEKTFKAHFRGCVCAANLPFSTGTIYNRMTQQPFSKIHIKSI